MPWGPLPTYFGMAPTLGGTFIDIEVLGGISVGGDIRSANWDGTIPIDLSNGIDTGATVGFAFDALAGAAQLQELYTSGLIHVNDGTGQIILDPAAWTDTTLITLNRGYTNSALIGVGDATNTQRLGLSAPYDTTLANRAEINIYGDDNAGFTGDIHLSPGATGFIVFGGEIDNDISPSADSTYDLGTNALQWAEAHIDLVFADDVRLSNGAVGTPSLAFEGDPDTGILSPGANSIGLATAGVLRIRLTDAQLRLVETGTLTRPTYSFDGRTGTGLYSPAIDEVGLVGGTAEMFTGLNASTDEVRILPAHDNTHGSDPLLRISSTGLLREDSSARWLKKDISDATSMLAAIPIPPPSRFRWRAQKTTRAVDDVDSDRWNYGWIADQWADTLPEAAMYSEDGRPSNYELKAVVAQLAAHIIVLNERLEALEREA